MPLRQIGFTGTQDGCTPLQKLALLREFRVLKHSRLHHGDCVGADEQAWQIAKGLGWRTVCHPPTEGAKRAYTVNDETRTEFPYLVRNRNIVTEVETLYACPSGPEKRRSGTWATVRAARKAGIEVIVIWPDGIAHREEP